MPLPTLKRSPPSRKPRVSGRGFPSAGPLNRSAQLNYKPSFAMPATTTEITAQAACRYVATCAFGPAWEIPAQFAEEIFFWKRFIPTSEQLRAIVTTYRGIRNGSHRKRLFAAVREVCE
jgi:hypothetical protein